MLREKYAKYAKDLKKGDFLKQNAQFMKQSLFSFRKKTFQKRLTLKGSLFVTN